MDCETLLSGASIFHLVAEIVHSISLFCLYSLPVCRHVMNELLETERAYVEELLCVLQVCVDLIHLRLRRVSRVSWFFVFFLFTGICL